MRAAVEAMPPTITVAINSGIAAVKGIVVVHPSHPQKPTFVADTPNPAKIVDRDSPFAIPFNNANP
jgi:hypothetical protein